MKDRKAVQSASRLRTKTVMSLNRHQQRSSSADMFHLRNEIDTEKRIFNEALNHSYYSFIFAVQVLYIYIFLSLWLKKLVTAATGTSDFSKWNLFKWWLWIGPTELTKLYTRKYCASWQNSWHEAYLLHSNITADISISWKYIRYYGSETFCYHQRATDDENLVAIIQ